MLTTTKIEKILQNKLYLIHYCIYYIFINLLQLIWTEQEKGKKREESKKLTIYDEKLK